MEFSTFTSGLQFVRSERFENIIIVQWNFAFINSFECWVFIELNLKRLFEFALSHFQDLTCEDDLRIDP